MAVHRFGSASQYLEKVRKNGRWLVRDRKLISRTGKIFSVRERNWKMMMCLPLLSIWDPLLWPESWVAPSNLGMAPVGASTLCMIGINSKNWIKFRLTIVILGFSV